jgi:hypothetical protein
LFNKITLFRVAGKKYLHKMEDPTQEQLSKQCDDDLAQGLSSLKIVTTTESILKDWHLNSCTMNESAKNGNETPGSIRQVLREQYLKQEGKGKKAKFTFIDGYKSQLTLLPLCSYTRMVEADEKDLDWLPQIYFSQHDAGGQSPRVPTEGISILCIVLILVSVLKEGELVFFYWKKLPGKTKDDKTRLLPSLWDEETSKEFLKIKILRGKNAETLHEKAQRELNLKDFTEWTPRRFVIALITKFTQENADWKKWVAGSYPRGLPSFYNHALGHVNKSPEWQAYWQFRFAKKEKEEKKGEIKAIEIKEEKDKEKEDDVALSVLKK